ncbi:MAG TPA: hypothetical protein DCS30_02190 [Rhizobiales bacterium]|nr:hypothetical protein [Hyphomicrobiales bacterium]
MPHCRGAITKPIAVCDEVDFIPLSPKHVIVFYRSNDFDITLPALSPPVSCSITKLTTIHSLKSDKDM